MSFSENLVNLRKDKKISQEVLADTLNVSRQTVYKWESDQSYPEMEKLLIMCDMFNVTLDELVKGNVEVNKAVDPNKNKENALKEAKRYGIYTGIATAIILIGIAALLFIIGEGNNDLLCIIGVAILLVCIGIATVIYIFTGMNHEEFIKDCKDLEFSFTREEEKQLSRKSSLFVGIGVFLIIIGIVTLILLYSLENYYISDTAIPVGILMIIISISTFIFIYYGQIESCMKKQEITKLIKSSDEKAIKVSNANKIVGKLSGVIMILATIIFLAIGLICDDWDLCWISFPIGGLCCAIVAIIFSKDND